MAYRAEELKDNSGYILGTAAYFRNINETTVFHYLTSDKESCNYYRFIKNAIDKIPGCVTEILFDLKNYQSCLSFVPSVKRDKLKSFVMSLYSFSKLAGSSPSDCSKCKAFLELSEITTKRLSRASESDIDKAMNVMYNGVKTNICSCDRLPLIKKAFESGINWTAGNDLKKMAYIKEVMGNHDQKFLGDVYHKYLYKHTNSQRLMGKNRRDIFSDDYIKEYEKKIFGTELSYFMSSFDYLGFYTERLKYVIKKMITDIGSKIDKKRFWIRTENAKLMKDAAASIEKSGVSSANLYAVLKNFELTDVTDKLMKILREAKQDGQMLKAKYPNALGTLPSYISKDNVVIDVNILPSINDTLLLYYHFIHLVGNFCKYDIKRKSDWQYDLQYYFDGMILDYDDPGRRNF